MVFSIFRDYVETSKVPGSHMFTEVRSYKKTFIYFFGEALAVNMFYHLSDSLLTAVERKLQYISTNC